MTLEISTFDEDLLELSEFAERLEKFIAVEQNFVQGSLVLALSSRFGFGKTTFLNMWKNKLDCSENLDKPLVISLNAWESDYYGDPLFAIISSLVDSLRNGSDSAKTLVEAAKAVGWFTTAIGGQIAKKITGIDAIAAGDFAEKKTPSKASEILPADAFSIFQCRKQAMIHLQQSIKDFVSDSGGRVLFLVDELDRCRPDYAISYLETIKHIFDVSGAVFILAADRQQLENSAKTAFGPDLDFEEYYRKFIHREVTLPPISESGYRNLANTYSKHYLIREGLRDCYMKLDSTCISHIVELISALRMTPRQIQEVFRILGHLLETSVEKRGRLYWCLGVGSIAMAAFKVSNTRIYHLLGARVLEPKEALDFLSGLPGDIYPEWWFKLFLTGGGLRINEGANLHEVMKTVGIMKVGEESSYLHDLGSWHQGWGARSIGNIDQIHGMIEQIVQWR
jgi:hypothetical protein